MFKIITDLESGRGRLEEVVVYERFQYKAVTEDIFGVLGRLSLMGGGRLREVIARAGSTVKQLFHSRLLDMR